RTAHGIGHLPGALSRASPRAGAAAGPAVKLSVLALDYDGTSATRDVMDPGVREALAAARAHHISVMLVTGRRLDDLQRVAGDLQFLDAVVAENGAVLHFPASGYTTTLGPPPSPPLLPELTPRGRA